MPIASNFTSILHDSTEITFLQCYPNGYLKYTDLCNILQLTAGLHAEMGGISFTDMQAFDQAWVLSRMRVEIHRLPKWRDVVTVKTWINSLKNSRSVRCLEMYVGDEKIIGCETFWAVINTKLRKPEALALPHGHFVKYPEGATEKPFSKINIKEQPEVLQKYTVRLSDLDVVNHANNVKYLEWCLDYCNPERLLNQELQAFEMNFIKELSLGDSVEIGRHNDTFTISHNDKTCFALQLEWK